MKKRLLALLCFTIALTITGCGQSSDTITSKEMSKLESEIEKHIEEKEDKEPVGDKRDEVVLDHSYFEDYEKQFVSDSGYNKVFNKRCLYVDGIKVEMPYTIRDIEKMFNVNFVKVLTIARNYTYTVLVDDYDRAVVVRLSREGTKLAKEGNINEIEDIPVLAIAVPNSDSKLKIDGSKYQSICSIYNVTFEDVGEKINDYGYIHNIEQNLDVYIYIPEEIYVYHMFLKGDIPESVSVCGDIVFDAVHEGDDFYQFYYSEADYDVNYEYGFNTVNTHFGNYDLYIEENEYSEGFLYVYNDIEKCIYQMSVEDVIKPQLYDYEKFGEIITQGILDEYRAAK